MTFTVPMEPQEEALLAETARAKGISTDLLVREALEKILAEAARSTTTKTDHRSVWEIFEEGINDIPLGYGNH